jgi:hypothetical protein
VKRKRFVGYSVVYEDLTGSSVLVREPRQCCDLRRGREARRKVYVSTRELKQPILVRRARGDRKGESATSPYCLRQDRMARKAKATSVEHETGSIECKTARDSGRRAGYEGEGEYSGERNRA